MEQLLSAREAHIEALPTLLCSANGPVRWHPSRLFAVPTGGPPPSGAAKPAAATAPPPPPLPPAAAFPAAAVPAAATPAIDLASEESKDNANDLLAGTSLGRAAALVPGSTTTHTNVKLTATFGQKMSPVWAYFMRFWLAVLSEPNQGKNLKCCLRRGGGKECPLYTHNGTKGLIKHLPRIYITGGEEVGPRREQRLSTAEMSARRGTRRGIRLCTTSDGPRPGPVRENTWAASWAWRSRP